jgi:hypothetical protein
MANVRTFYACQKVQLGHVSGSDAVGTVTDVSFETINSLQSVGITSNFNLEPVYQIGALEPGDIAEDIPDVEVSLTRTLDGSQTIYERTMIKEGEADTAKDLTECSDNRSAVRLIIYPQTVTKATGTITSACIIRPAYLSSISYSFPTDGFFQEEATVVGNNKSWSLGGSNNDAPSENSAKTGVARRQFLNVDGSTFPIAVGAAHGAGNFAKFSGAMPPDARIQNISVSVDLGREEIFELGKRLPFTRYINFPVEVNTEFEVISASGDLVGATETEEVCKNPKALDFKEIKIATCDGMVLDMGKKNKLQSVSAAGGDAGGDNVTYTYSYINYSKFKYTCPSAGSHSPTAAEKMEQVDLDNFNMQDYK